MTKLEQLENENQVLKQSVKDTYDTSQEIIADLKEECERWRKHYLNWRDAYIELDEKFHNLIKICVNQLDENKELRGEEICGLEHKTKQDC